MCGVQLKGRNIDKDLSLNETMDQLTMTNNVYWNGHVLTKEDGHMLRALEFETDIKGRK